MSDVEVCEHFSFHHSMHILKPNKPKELTKFGLKIRSELNKRNLIREASWPLIMRKQVTLGMTKLETICSWGMPNTTPGTWAISTSDTHTYRNNPTLKFKGDSLICLDKKCRE
ncbi:hypothetical protein N9D07_03020 [Alphaproteobacteria bacterium]|nr:hypothetical protein [Alphaproteobacteria bacterium]